MYQESSDIETIDWRQEAQAVINDVGFGLKTIEVSSINGGSDSEVYFNIETKESLKMCVELSSSGFKVVSHNFNSIDESCPDQTHYETPYALLNKYSEAFRQCFASALQRKLSDLLASN